MLSRLLWELKCMCRPGSQAEEIHVSYYCFYPRSLKMGDSFSLWTSFKATFNSQCNGSVERHRCGGGLGANPSLASDIWPWARSEWGVWTMSVFLTGSSEPQGRVLRFFSLLLQPEQFFFSLFYILGFHMKFHLKEKFSQLINKV